MEYNKYLTFSICKIMSPVVYKYIHWQLFIFYPKNIM